MLLFLNYIKHLHAFNSSKQLMKRSDVKTVQNLASASNMPESPLDKQLSSCESVSETRMSLFAAFYDHFNAVTQVQQMTEFGVYSSMICL